MPINLLPKDYQNELKRERLRRLIAVSGIAMFMIIVANAVLLLPPWVLFRVQETEQIRQLEATKQSPAFSRVTDVEREIEELNLKISIFNSREEGLFAASEAIKSVLSLRPADISVSDISFTAGDTAKSRGPRISISGTAKSRESLLEFARANETNEFVEKVNSPISNLLKETEIDYSLVLDLHD